MDRFIDANRRMWDSLVAQHLDSEFYGLDAFKAGGTSLKPIELEELGDQVQGKDLLHIQCHFGMDTLSWARLGARVTGSDISEPAIEAARGLAKELGIDARFVLSNTYDLERNLDGDFDLVFLSYGALCWLPDLSGLMRIVARFLRPGGQLYLAEFHPLWGTVGDDACAFDTSYFHTSDGPQRFEGAGDYAVHDDPTVRVSFEWQHTLGDVVTAVCDAGLRLEFLHEFPYSPWNFSPLLEEREPGRAVVKGHGDKMPLTYSLKATRTR